MSDYPKTFKYGRVFRIKLKRSDKASSFLLVNFFEYGLKVFQNGKLISKHFNAMSRLLKRLYKKDVFLKYNISLVTPVTKKPSETRMGKGKGERSHWECVVKKGGIILEIGHLSFFELMYGLRLLIQKLPFKIKVVKNVY